MMRKVKIGVIGCGMISNVYLTNMTTRYSEYLEVAACADMFIEKAKESAEKFNIPIACSVDELVNNPEIEIVVNLTIPASHYEINMAALKAGKNIYCEKPLALTPEDGKRTIEFAAEKGLLVGCAPDTFLGAGLQACRKALDEGRIGKPLSITANMAFHGHETWLPNPVNFYKKGAGPMWDMGPYYITAMVAMLGPIKRISCFAKKSFEQRTVTGSSPLKGQKIDVEVLTHYSGLIDFENGTIASINMSFDMWKSNLPCFEMHGTTGSMIVPDPNTFGGPVKILSGESVINKLDGLAPYDAVRTLLSPEIADLFVEVPISADWKQNMRGLGVLDMAHALVDGLIPKANGDMAYHVLEALNGFDTASNEGIIYNMKSTCARPDVLDLKDSELFA